LHLKNPEGLAYTFDYDLDLGKTSVVDAEKNLTKYCYEKKQNENVAFHVIQPRDIAPHHTRVWGISRLLDICIGLR